ncbi:MAG: DUF4147 domain-containing protein [Candidatus Bipolaricaulota bacterium]|nr:DUF4147 domain-containing protein [Candidatus Bipolaricaulota bacterium]
MIRFDRSKLRESEGRECGLSLMEGTLEAVSPGRLVRSLVIREGNVLRVGTERYPLGDRRVFLLGAGKAAAAVAQELEAVLGDTLTAGVVVTRYGYAAPTTRVQVVEGGHPLPDQNSVAGAGALRALAKTVRDGDLVLCAFSGGGSSLLSLPSPGIELADLRALNEMLLRSGAPISVLNVVRRHVAPLLGGGLARLLAPAQVVTLLLSDVVGDSIETIASGPTVPDPTTFEDAREALSHLELWEQIPQSIRDRITLGLGGRAQETLKAGDPAFARAETHILGNNWTAVAAALKEGERLGLSARALDEPVIGEANLAGERLARIALDLGGGSERSVIVAGGETTVTVRGSGKGGRNQEVALAAALKLEGATNLTVAVLATDGTDGPTEACGGVVDGETTPRARAAGMDPAEALAKNDSYSLLSATGDLLFTGPTRTNVADLFFIFHDPHSRWPAQPARVRPLFAHLRATLR